MSTLRTNTLQTLDSLFTVDVEDLAGLPGSFQQYKDDVQNSADITKGAALVGYRRRTQHAKNDDTLSVKDFSQLGFGVPGNGVQADDEAAWDAMVAALNAGTIPAAVRIPAGTYLLNKTYTITRSGFSLIGDGVDTTVIKRTDGTFGDSFVFSRTDPTTQQLAGGNIMNITFWCQADMSTGGVLRFRNCTRIFLRGVFIRNCFKGIWLEGIRDSRFTDFEIIQGEHYTVDRTGAYHIHFGQPANPALKSTETLFSNFNMTTAGNAGDVNGCIRIDGAVDGAWFNNAHWFGGKTAGVIISGDGVDDISNLSFTGCMFDQFTARNLIVQGTTTDANKFRLIRFVGCKFQGGTTGIAAIDVASGVKTLEFESCSFGVTPGQGFQVGAGNVTFMGCDFEAINQSAAANGYGIQVPLSASNSTVLVVKSCKFEASNLTYGIHLLNNSAEYHIHDNTFRNQSGSMSAEVYFAGDTLIGTCSGNDVARTAAGDIAAAATVLNPNIAVDALNLTGATTTVNLIKPYWHGRRVSIKANTAAQNMTQSSGAGSLRNRAGAATTAIAISDVYLYEYRGDSFRWHQLG